MAPSRTPHMAGSPCQPPSVAPSNSETRAGDVGEAGAAGGLAGGWEQPRRKETDREKPRMAGKIARIFQVGRLQITGPTHDVVSASMTGARGNEDLRPRCGRHHAARAGWV